MSKESSGRSTPRLIRSWLITALAVFVALNILLAVIRPLLPYIVVGIVLFAVAGWVFGRGGH